MSYAAPIHGAGIRVRLFAGARDAAGADEIRVALPPGATAGDLLDRIVAEHGGKADAAATLLAACRVAVDHEFADLRAVLPAGAEVALIPPVSGG